MHMQMCQFHGIFPFNAISKNPKISEFNSEFTSAYAVNSFDQNLLSQTMIAEGQTQQLLVSNLMLYYMKTLIVRNVGRPK